MPITAEIENIKKLESVGFNHAQAVALSEIHETTAQDSNQDLKEFIRAELKDFRSEITSEIIGLEHKMNASFLDVREEICGVKGEIKGSQSQSALLFKIFVIVCFWLSIAVVILKS